MQQQWLAAALKYCEEHQLLPFFAHPDVRLHEGKICIDDQSHLVISAPAEQPSAWLREFCLDLDDFIAHTVTLQTHMDAIGALCAFRDCGDAGWLFGELRALALALRDSRQSESE